MRIALTALAGVALAGCATIITGGDDEVDINTPGIAGAQCEIRTFNGSVRARVVTPGTIEVNKSSKDLEAVCSKDGFAEGRSVVQAGFEPWFVGNLFIGGLIGIIVDITTSNFYKYDDSIAVYMEPDEGARQTASSGSSRRSDRAARGDDFGASAAPRRDSVASRAGGDVAVYLGFTNSQEWADNTAEFMWVAERQLLDGVRPVVQQRIDPASGQPRFHIYGADVDSFEADEICAGLEDNGYLCRVVEARR